MSDRFDEAGDGPGGRPAERAVARDAGEVGRDAGEGVDESDASPRSPVRPDGRRRPVDPGYLGSERVTWWIFNACAIGGTGIVALIVLLAVDEAWWVTALVVGGWGGFAALLLWGVLWHLPRSYRAMDWCVHPDRVSLRKGVWWKRAITVPRVRVQHTDVKQGPLQRRFGISTLVIHTAGTQHAKVELQGLRLEVAEHLRDWLLEPTHRARASGADGPLRAPETGGSDTGREHAEPGAGESDGGAGVDDTTGAGERTGADASGRVGGGDG
ncbi:MAG: PH domain-containing protein [Phycisphaerales bacterium JB040]